MITERELQEAIAECHEQKNPNASTCAKLASYYTILDHLSINHSYASEPTGQVRYDSGSEFSKAIRGRDTEKVLSIVDELMEALSVLSPKLYGVTMKRIYDL